MSASWDEGLALLERAAAQLAAADPGELDGEGLTDALERVEGVEGRLCAVRAGLVGAVEAEGTWAVGGARSLNAWVRERTGRLGREAARLTRQARALRDHLPGTRQALVAGEIGPEHLAVLVQHATASPGCVAMLGDEELGEEFLVGAARSLDAGRLATLVRNWAVRADPEAADRRWKEEAEGEEFSLSRTTDGFHGRVWLSEANGMLLQRALEAQAGRRAAGDERTAAQRRAGALVELAGAVLDSGTLQPGARIRPHLAITATLETLLGLTRAQHPTPDRGASPGSGTRPGPAGAGSRSPGSGGTGPEAGSTGESGAVLGVIDTAVDHEGLRGVEPARLEDGTPIPFGLFAQLACESRLHRVVFGPGSEVLDVGREERLFTAGQTRGIIARDGHCQFPSCTAPPGQGEIHHSLWWYAHHGDTTTANGILLCRYHHAFVHQRELAIERYAQRWRFVRPNGTTFGETPITTPTQPTLH